MGKTKETANLVSNGFLTPNNGKLGIGTGNPEEIVHILGSTETIGSRDGVTLQHSTATAAADNGLPLVWSGYVGSGSGLQNYGLASICGRKENSNTDDGAAYLQFGTGNVNGAIIERLRITSDGTIGIGADDPSSNALLEIRGGAGGKNTRLLFNSKPVRTTGSIGEIFFRNNDDSVAYIICGHDGANDAGNLSFATQVTGGSLTEKLRITSTGKIGVNNTSPSVSVDLSENTDAVALPTGTTAQRPSGTDAYIRKNSTNNALEFYNGTNWVEIITDYFPTGSTTLG